jgi:hypothetical protein
LQEAFINYVYFYFFIIFDFVRLYLGREAVLEGEGDIY